MHRNDCLNLTRREWGDLRLSRNFLHSNSDLLMAMKMSQKCRPIADACPCIPNKFVELTPSQNGPPTQAG